MMAPPSRKNEAQPEPMPSERGNAERKKPSLKGFMIAFRIGAPSGGEKAQSSRMACRTPKEAGFLNAKGRSALKLRKALMKAKHGTSGWPARRRRKREFLGEGPQRIEASQGADESDCIDEWQPGVARWLQVAEGSGAMKSERGNARMVHASPQEAPDIRPRVRKPLRGTRSDPEAPERFPCRPNKGSAGRHFQNP